ncbi:ribosomal-processing cysteine protease Prp [Butyrivibrio sp. VCB2006]|uniref:ribosomal-processing cysteine protease Prp n=1 Tax=Butyrivibrio sp. VCB2006 TaxID=1280679 RepID=UPI0003FD533D|nr:ribosomal-processing cysteine protease Prp [Butyrivibrio sp. VCB2006]
MTTITITKTSDDAYKCIECKGHAGFAEYGEDIVCAAVSVLTINLANSVENLTDDKFDIEQDEEIGLIRLRFETVPSHDADLLLRSFELGVDSIFRQYGKKFLNIKFRRE